MRYEITKMIETDLCQNMRRCFADAVHEQMADKDRIWVVTGDMGFGMWDNVRSRYPERFINTRAAEQAMMGVAVGLALEGKIPIVYSITPFLLYRPFETIRNYVNRELIPVKLVGSGRGQDYRHDGFSHWAQEDEAVMSMFTNIESRWPQNCEEIPELVDTMIRCSKPWYLNLKR